MAKKRYVVTMDFYMWAEDDKEVKRRAKTFTDGLNKVNDGHADVVSIHEQPTGTIELREVK